MLSKGQRTAILELHAQKVSKGEIARVLGLPFHRTQNPAIAVLGCAGTDPIRESGTLPAADSGGVGQLQGLIYNTHVVVLCGTGRQMIPVPEMEAFGERFGFQFRAHELGDANRSGRVERPLSA